MDRFDQGWFDDDVVTQYQEYLHDEILSYLYEVACGGNTVMFFCKLTKMPEYSAFGRLPLLLLTVSLDTTECERGFSHAQSCEK